MIPVLALCLVTQPAGVDRADVIAAAERYAAHRWTMSQSNLGADCAPADYKSDYEPGPQVALPYAWGGSMTLEQFDARLAKGEAAGSHSWHGILACVAGVDCSGFVSQVWKTDKRYSTSSFSQVTDEIDVDAIAPGDAFNKPGRHIVLFAGFNEAGEPTFYEAAGGAAKVRLHSGWSYLDGYTPIRYKHIRDTPPEPRAKAPTASGPYDAGAKALSATAADPDTPEPTKVSPPITLIVVFGAGLIGLIVWMLRKER